MNWEIKTKPKEEHSNLNLECIHCKNFFTCKLEKLKGGCLQFEEREEVHSG